MLERPKYIYIEGMNLAGRSFTTNSFVARRAESWGVRRHSLSEENRLCDFADEMFELGEYHSETIGTVYTAALMADLDKFERPAMHTVQESTILLRSIAFHAINGNDRILNILEGMADQHPKFDASFMLTASHSARMRRLKERGASASALDRLVDQDPERFFAMENLLAKLAVEHFNATIIDTSSTPVEEVVRQMEGVVFLINSSSRNE